MDWVRLSVADLRGIIDSTLPASSKVSMLLMYLRADRASGWRMPWEDYGMLVAVAHDESAEAVEAFNQQLRDDVGDDIYNGVVPSTLAQAVLDEISKLTEDQLLRWYNIRRDESVWDNMPLDKAVFAWRDSLDK
jgi:hypothetical protein